MKKLFISRQQFIPDQMNSLDIQEVPVFIKLRKPALSSKIKSGQVRVDENQSLNKQRKCYDILLTFLPPKIHIHKLKSYLKQTWVSEIGYEIPFPRFIIVFRREDFFGLELKDEQTLEEFTLSRLKTEVHLQIFPYQIQVRIEDKIVEVTTSSLVSSTFFKKDLLKLFRLLFRFQCICFLDFHGRQQTISHAYHKLIDGFLKMSIFIHERRIKEERNFSHLILYFLLGKEQFNSYFDLEVDYEKPISIRIKKVKQKISFEKKLKQIFSIFTPSCLIRNEFIFSIFKIYSSHQLDSRINYLMSLSQKSHVTKQCHDKCFFKFVIFRNSKQDLEPEAQDGIYSSFIELSLDSSLDQHFHKIKQQFFLSYRICLSDAKSYFFIAHVSSTFKKSCVLSQSVKLFEYFKDFSEMVCLKIKVVPRRIPQILCHFYEDGKKTNSLQVLDFSSKAGINLLLIKLKINDPQLKLAIVDICFVDKRGFRQSLIELYNNSTGSSLLNSSLEKSTHAYEFFPTLKKYFQFPLYTLDTDLSELLTLEFQLSNREQNQPIQEIYMQRYLLHLLFSFEILLHKSSTSLIEEKEEKGLRLSEQETIVFILRNFLFFLKAATKVKARKCEGESFKLFRKL